MNDLPIEHVYYILNYVNFKYRIICKLWKTIIDSSKFAKKRLKVIKKDDISEASKKLENSFRKFKQKVIEKIEPKIEKFEYHVTLRQIQIIIGPNIIHYRYSKIYKNYLVSKIIAENEKTKITLTNMSEFIIKHFLHEIFYIFFLMRFIR